MRREQTIEVLVQINPAEVLAELTGEEILSAAIQSNDKDQIETIIEGYIEHYGVTEFIKGLIKEHIEHYGVAEFIKQDQIETIIEGYIEHYGVTEFIKQILEFTVYKTVVQQAVEEGELNLLLEELKNTEMKVLEELVKDRGYLLSLSPTARLRIIEKIAVTLDD